MGSINRDMFTSEAGQSRRRKPLMTFLLIFVALATAYIAGCRRTGTWLAKEEMPQHADAIILLMGSFPERVLQAVDIYHSGISDSLIIVHENMGGYGALEARGVKVVRTTEQARDASVALGVPPGNIIILPGDARSTLDEAVAVNNYLAGKPWLDTLILVSSPAHMRRARMIFKTVLRESAIHAYIGCSPSRYSSFNPDRWWLRKEDIQSVLSEWLKILSFILFEKGKIVYN